MKFFKISTILLILSITFVQITYQEDIDDYDDDEDDYDDDDDDDLDLEGRNADDLVIEEPLIEDPVPEALKGDPSTEEEEKVDSVSSSSEEPSSSPKKGILTELINLII
ncbi:hypothetical protein PVAND_016384 [Polypedilum vanderplanki]|uniref:Secreted protein n=1 Tax=Polypedilum vanderplanki TaxID=319348 RepID=A0A9J6BF03_POLVA|nr:hypothetical protein PVAND_016384 [Polypedilum vanderplanki]